MTFLWYNKFACDAIEIPVVQILQKNCIFVHKGKFEHYTLFKNTNQSYLKYFDYKCSEDHVILYVKKKYIELIGIYDTNLYFRKQMHLCATKCSVKLIKIPIKERIIFIHHNNTMKDIFVVFHCKMNNIVIPKKNYLRAIFCQLARVMPIVHTTQSAKERRGVEWLWK